jgi:hypothetical protein
LFSFLPQNKTFLHFAPNDSRYRRLEGHGLAHETDKTQSHEKDHFDGVNPAVRVHAVLGAVELEDSLADKNHTYLTFKIW